MFNLSEKQKTKLTLGTTALATPVFIFTGYEMVKQREILSMIPESEYISPLSKKEDLQIMDGMILIPFILSALTAYCAGWSIKELNKYKKT